MRYRRSLETLGKYFAKKGKVMSMAEYKEAKDTPIRFMIVRRTFGSWTRMIQMLERNCPEEFEAATNPKKPAKPAKPAPKKAEVKEKDA